MTGPVPEGTVAIALSETRWPGWRARINGVEAPLVPWGPAFQSAAVVPGEALDLRFEFSPTRWFWWAALSAAAWAAWVIALAKRLEPA